MRTWILALVVALSGMAASDAQASGCAAPFCAHNGYGAAWGVNGKVGFQAAPWYLYWPYDAHFQLPAPVYGAHTPPPTMGGYSSMPFFPSHGTPYIPGSPLNIYPYGPTVAPGYAR